MIQKEHIIQEVMEDHKAAMEVEELQMITIHMEEVGVKELIHTNQQVGH